MSLQNFLSPQARYFGAGPTAMPTEPTKSAQPNKLIVSIMPTLLVLPATPTMPTDLACYAYTANKKQPLNYRFVAGLTSH